MSRNLTAAATAFALALGFACPAFADAAAHGFTSVQLKATVFVANYDATGARTMIVQPIMYILDPSNPKIGRRRLSGRRPRTRSSLMCMR